MARRHSPARCSCRVVPPIRDARFVELNLVVFMCNSGRRQERVCRAQRPAAKIDALATLAGGRDRTSAFEPAETPANCRLFMRDRFEPAETPENCGLFVGSGQGFASDSRATSPVLLRHEPRTEAPISSPLEPPIWPPISPPTRPSAGLGGGYGPR
jgi:hypothetical protein